MSTTQQEKNYQILLQRIDAIETKRRQLIAQQDDMQKQQALKNQRIVPCKI